MKSRHAFAIIFLSFLVSPTILAASVSLITKKADPKNNVQYTYNYTCNNGTKGTLAIQAANDSDAQKQAETRARRVCEEI